jgi:hypothetical protein
MKKLFAQIVLGSVLAVFFTTQRASAQNYLIDWHQVAGGGDTSTGGTYSVTGTIGQHDAGIGMTGGVYSLTGGFWSLASVVQTTGRPALSISYSSNSVIVSWQSQNGWALQQNPNLNTPAGWTNSSGLVTVNGVSYHNVNNPTSALFFRLKHN